MYSRYSGGLSYAEKFDSILHFFIPKEKVEEIRGKDGKTDRGEPEARSMTSFFSSSFYGAFRRRLVLRGWGGELLRRDNVDKRKRKKRFIRLQVHPYRDLLTGLITPVSLYL
jgi:hypothetical protein